MTARTCGPGSLREWEREDCRVEVGGKGVLEVSGSFDVDCNSRGKPVGLLGVCREAAVRTEVIVGLFVVVLLLSDDGASRSLFTQRVQEKISPT